MGGRAYCNHAITAGVDSSAVPGGSSQTCHQRWACLEPSHRNRRSSDIRDQVTNDREAICPKIEVAIDIPLMVVVGLFFLISASDRGRRSFMSGSDTR